MRSTSNPVFRNLPAQAGGYSAFGAASSRPSYSEHQGYSEHPGYPQSSSSDRPITIDDVVTKTGITLGALIIAAIASFFVTAGSPTLAGPLFFGGLIGGLVLGLVLSFTQLKFNPVAVIAYAVFEGAVLGTISQMFSGLEFSGTSGSTLVTEAVLGTIGVFAGMLVVYKTGAVRVTPRFQRMMMGAFIGLMVLILGNFVAGFFHAGGFQLYTGGPIAIIFSLVCIGIAAFSFLLDFDAADQLIRAQAPAKMAWGIAFGLTVTLVWLYLEILRLLSYLNDR